MRWADPQWLLLLVLLPPWELWRRRVAQRAPAVLVADAAQVSVLPITARVRAHRWVAWLRLLVAALAIVALARPQLVERETKVHSRGVDLVVAIDLSTSMLAEDLASGGGARRNRLTVAKEVLAAFLQQRPGDRIGLIAFAARPYSAAPLTLDHSWLQNVVARLEAGAIEDGTAVGDAILAAVNRLRPRSATTVPAPNASPGGESRAIIVLTDGRNNAGGSEPAVAAAAARALGIRVHTIGIGSRGEAVIPVDDPLGGTSYRAVAADLDENSLREIAATTGGSYFRASDGDVLASAFAAIDRLEKRSHEHTVYFSYRELFPVLLLLAFAGGLLDLVLRSTLLQVGP